MRIIRRHQTRAVPWKNGGGITHEIAAHPEGADFGTFQWRLSMAEVAADGPFSAFAGIDRTLTLLEGDGLVLDFGGGSDSSGGGAVTLAPGDPPLAFPGEAPVTGRLCGGPVLDFNVMTRRGAAAHRAVLLRPPAALPDGCAAVLCRAGRVTLGAGSLMPGDCALLAPGEAGALTTGGAGEIVAVIIDTIDAGGAAGEYRARTPQQTAAAGPQP